MLEDLGSRNGTLLRGELVRCVSLADGDVFEAGRTLFMFREVSAPPAVQEAHAGLDTLAPELSMAFQQLLRIAPSDVAVVLRGETGSGKEVVARAIHEHSGRRGRFVPVNCGALVDNLVQSELFGYKKGAFSGATEDRLGFVRAAEGGTLFLDEIGDMPASSQTVLLRVLQEREVTPVGAHAPIKVDFRVLSATHRDLPQMVERGLFRTDLWARLAGYELMLPALRDRREDIGLLVSHLVRRHAPGRSVTFSPDAARALFDYGWPLNVRELEQCLARSIVLSKNQSIEPEHLPDAVANAGPTQAVAPPTRAKESLDVEETALREKLIALLSSNQGNVSAVAHALGKDRKQIHRWIARFGIDVDALRKR
jgi:DNA-binding NtrC family response regulator